MLRDDLGVGWRWSGERKFKGEGLYVELWLIGTVVGQKPTQQSKAIFP